MKKNAKKVLALLLASTMLFAAAGCGKTEEAPVDGEQTTTTSTEGEKVFRVGAKDPKCVFDPNQYTYTHVFVVTDNVLESLIKPLNDGSLVPELLTEMPTLSEDMKTYSFELKEGVKFHNGEILTSNDVKYSYERLIKKQVMGSILSPVVGYQELVDGTATELAGFEIIDDTHFNIHLSDVYTPFMSVLATPYAAIFPAKACEEAGDTWGRDVLIGTGYFTFDKYEQGVGVTLSKFDEHHDQVAKIDRVEYKFIEDDNTQVLEYQKGNLDYVEIQSTMYPVYSADPELKDQLVPFQPAGGFYILYNTKEMSDPRVREAFSISFDRNVICENVFHGTAAPSKSFIPAGLIGHDEEAEVYPYDPERAKQLLTEAGYPNGYDVRLTLNAAYPLDIPIATTIQEQAKAAGFNVTLDQVDSAAWGEMKLKDRKSVV